MEQGAFTVKNAQIKPKCFSNKAGFPPPSFDRFKNRPSTKDWENHREKRINISIWKELWTVDNILAGEYPSGKQQFTLPYLKPNS